MEGDNGGDQEVPDPKFSPSLNTPDQNGFDSAVQSNGNNGGNPMVEAMPVAGQQPQWNVPMGQEMMDNGGHGLTQIFAQVPKNGDNGGHLRNGPTPCKQMRLMCQAEQEEEVAGFALINHSENCSDGQHVHGNDATVG